MGGGSPAKALKLGRVFDMRSLFLLCLVLFSTLSHAGSLPTPTRTPFPLFYPTPDRAKPSFTIILNSKDPQQPDLNQIENEYQTLINEVVTAMVKKGDAAALGKAQIAFFNRAAKLRVDKRNLTRMRSGYYLWVAKAFYDLRKLKDSEFYLKLALSYDPQNPWALALQSELKGVKTNSGLTHLNGN